MQDFFTNASTDPNLQTLRIGAIINMLVKKNTKKQSGLLSYCGKLFKAKLPANLKEGDKIKVQIGSNDKQILLKLLEVNDKKINEEVKIYHEDPTIYKENGQLRKNKAKKSPCVIC